MFYLIHIKKVANVFIASMIFCLCAQYASAQKVKISGRVTDNGSGEYLIASHVFDLNNSQGSITNEYGYYSLFLEKGDTAELVCSYVGYINKTVSMILRKDTIVNFQLSTASNLKEIVILGQEKKTIINSSQMSLNEIPTRDIKLMPNLFGEPNLMKSLQMLPGVQSGNDGDSHFYVRGGSPDQNLILLDEVPLYYVSHYGGIFSLFNVDAINDVKLIKGGFPAKYGGRLSSVLNVYMREGNKQKFQGNVNIGLLSSGGLIEGPVIKDKSSFLFSYRRSMLDLYTRIISGLENGSKNGFGFYDINGKFNLKISEKDHFYLSIYNGNDNIFTKIKETEEIPYNSENEIEWGNTAVAARWNHAFSQSLFANSTVIYSKYRLLSSNFTEYPGRFESEHTYQSFIEDIAMKSDFEWKVTNNNEVKFGLSGTRHLFNPGIFSLNSVGNDIIQTDTTTGSNRIVTQELNAYFSDEFKLNRLRGNLGVHFSLYRLPQTTFNSIEPRASISYALYSNGSLKASYARMKQYVHLLSNSGIGLPTDLWVPSTAYVPPQQSDQWALGWAHYINKFDLELSVEGYYKKMSHLIEYKEGTSFFSGTDWQERVEIDGDGEAFGMEFFAQKKIGCSTGWISYTWSKNRRQFENINRGNPFYYRYDRPHEVNFLFNHEIRKGINFSVSWVFKKGNPITLPSGKYQLNNLNPGLEYGDDPTIIHIYPGKNQFRMRDYHRLDISLSWNMKRTKLDHTWSFGIINVYNRMNPSYYKMTVKRDGSLSLIQVTEFPFLPSISYSLKF